MIIKSSRQTIGVNQLVNILGKHLYKNLDGAFKIEYSSNMCDVYVTLLYQLPFLQQVPGKGKEYNDVHEMILDINITTYANKIRVNVVELSPEEKTLGHDVYPPDSLGNLQLSRKLIFEGVMKRVCRAYRDYNFLI